MTYKWDKASAFNYAKELAAKISDENYADRDVLEGEQLLSITPSRQINLFIIRELYEKWQTETRRMESPYFDYTNPAVKQALIQFMNTVSQFIAVKRHEFETLSTQAIFKTLELLLQPETFFEQFLRDLPNFRLSDDFIQENNKYFVQYRFVMNELKESLNHQQTIYANEAITIAKNSLTKGTIESPTDLMEQLNAIIPTPSGLKEYPAVASYREEIEGKETTQKSFFDQLVEERLSEKIKAETPKTPIPNVVPVIETDHTSVITPPVIPVIAPPVRPQTEPVVEQMITDKPKRLNEQLEQTNQTLNDRATTSENAQAVTSNYHRISKIESIRKSISLNQRFLFIHNLFGGNVEAFSQALDEIDTLQSFADARELVLKKYVPRYLWDVTSVEAEEFFEILKRRFN